MVNISLRQSRATQIVGMVVSLMVLPTLPTLALPIAANDGTRTIVNPSNNTFEITGGTLSGDRSNLFHSFSQFNLTQNQVANFVSQPGVNNILGRVVGGSPSVINGLIQVTNGNANLFLMNPAGIVFGQGASLNIPASFTATTATAIAFGNNNGSNNLFTALGNNDYANLNGNPSNFAFSPLGIVSSNSLVVSSNDNFALVPDPIAGGTLGIVGRVDRVFRISRPGNILSLEINATDFCQQVGGCPNGVPPENWSLPAVEIPRLLTLGAGTTGAESPIEIRNPNLSPPSLISNLVNNSGNSLPPTAEQLNQLLQGGTQNLSSTSLGVALGGSQGSSPSQQPIEGGNLGNLPLPALIIGSLGSGGVLPRGDMNLVIENSAVAGANPRTLIGNGQIGNNPLGNGQLGNNPLGDNPQIGTQPRPGGIIGAIAERNPNDPNNPNDAPLGRIPPLIGLPLASGSALGNPLNNLSLAVLAREARLTNQFSNFVGRPPSGPNFRAAAPQREMNPLEIQQILQNNQAQTSVKSGVIYLNFISQADGAASDNDPLELVLLTPEGTALRQTIPGTTRSRVLRTALNFRGKITTRNRSSRGFLPEAQQLYQWFIAPLEQQLQATGVNNLIMITDDGLRSLPIAALHDGQGFLIERYSVTLVPTLTLTDLSYRDIRRSQILAMGASRFTDKEPLPAVPLELQEVVGQLQGQLFLNESFTLDNLRRQRQEQPFQIIHLATHAVFAPGDQSNSYIQLWDSRLVLDQLKQLRWNDPPVDLLVLSACDTAIGDQQAELGFAGLAIQAGVKSALASLWSVSDEGTLGLMREFYSQLGKAPIKAEALRQAQLAMLRGEVYLSDGKLITSHGQVVLPPELAKLGNVKLDHPYFWSAFTLIGSPW